MSWVNVTLWAILFIHYDEKIEINNQVCKFYKEAYLKGFLCATAKTCFYVCILTIRFERRSSFLSGFVYKGNMLLFFFFIVSSFI